MRILFDSHAFVWFLAGDRRFSRRAREMLDSDDVTACVSAVTAWEIANKVRLGKWPEATELATTFHEVIAANAFEPVGIKVEHARIAGLLPGAHRDPFDRMLAAQSQVESMPLVTADATFQSFGTRILW